MPLLTFRDVTLSLGHPPLLDGVGLAIERGERLALVGRNGAGKSTLLRLVAGEIEPDGGQIVRAQGLKLATLAQDVPQAVSGSVFSVVAQGLGETGPLIERYHRLAHEIAAQPERLAELAACQHELEAAGGWALKQRVEAMLSRLQLDPEPDIARLSGGMKRRVMLARALVAEPDLLLLDEPTNHLDIAAITWLEEFLLDWNGTLLFITHDRAFLQRLATRILELDRGRLADYPGDWNTYLARKAQRLAAEDRANAEFDKKLAQEEAWIRKGVQARRTRNEGRVRQLEKMRAAFSERRSRMGSASMAIQEAARSGKIVVEAEGVGFDYAGKTVIRDLTTTLLRGDKVGIIGPNGAGKTTLLKLLLGELSPTRGRLKRGTNLSVAYFDQYRAVLDEEKSVRDNVGEGRDMLTINGQPKHVLSYLQDFLFTPGRARQPVKALSGGERNRLLLAKLFTQPSNLLVLDEPTNDLDADTLELLEELLIDYAGTVLLVSHDRAFLDNVVTSTLVFEGEGRVNEYVGGYADWLRQRPQPSVARAEARPAPTPPGPPTPATAAPAKPRKRSFKEQRELDELPQKIEALEAEREALHAQMSAGDFFKQERQTIAGAQARLAEIEQALEAAYARWEILEGLGA